MLVEREREREGNGWGGERENICLAGEKGGEQKPQNYSMPS